MTLKMKELESRTGVSREAIRFYIREGLLPEPEKPRRNVAIYSEEHVDRIKLIKQLQDEHDMPLRKVKSLLESDALGTRFNDLSLFLPALMRDVRPAADRSLSDVAAATGIPADEIREMHAADVVSIKDGGLLDYRDAALLEQWAAARQRGFNREHRYDTSYLQHYAKVAKALADFEVDKFFAEFSASMDGEAGASLGADGIEFANALFTLLHTRALLRAIDDRAS